MSSKFGVVGFGEGEQGDDGSATGGFLDLRGDSVMKSVWPT